MMSDNDSSDEYDFPSDEDAYPDDDEDFVLAEDDGASGIGTQEAPAAGEEAPLPLDLAAFRQDWLKEVDKAAPRRPATFSPSRRSSGATAFLRLFSHPDLVDHILSSPLLLPSDLASLALSHSIFRIPTQSLLFRHVSIPTLLRGSALSSLFDSNPSLAQLIRSATISLGDPLEMAAEIVAVQEKMWDKKRKEGSQAIAYYGTPDGKSVARRQWEVDLRKKLPAHHEETDEATLARARRSSHIVWALHRLSQQDREVLLTQLRAKLLQWPLGFVPSPPLRRLFEHLAPSLVELVILPPLSHHFFALFTLLPAFTSLRSLTIRGDSTSILRFEDDFSTLDSCKDLKPILHLPAPALPLQPGSHGLLGAPPNVEKLKLESVVVYWETGGRDEGGNEMNGTKQPGWSLDELELRNVVIKREPASSKKHSSGGEPVIEPCKEKEHDQPTREAVKFKDRFAPDSLLYFHLANFVALSSSTNSSSLTSFALINVDGVVPSTIYPAIDSAGPSLRHLTLHNINLSSPSPSSPSASPSSTITVDFPLSPLPCTSTTFNQHKERRATLSSLVAAAQHWHRYDSSSDPSSTLRLSAQAHTLYWPSNTLSSALRRCTALRTLRLGASLQKCSNSPHSPDVLDALLETRPPIELISLRLGAEGPTREEGFLDLEGWEEVGRKVGELGGWETVRKEDCTVVVALRTSRR